MDPAATLKFLITVWLALVLPLNAPPKMVKMSVAGLGAVPNARPHDPAFAWSPGLVITPPNPLPMVTISVTCVAPRLIVLAPRPVVIVSLPGPPVMVLPVPGTPPPSPPVIVLFPIAEPVMLELK